jgi:hypothetical protein
MANYTYPLINVGADQVIEQVIRISEKLDADGRPAQASVCRQAIIAHRDELKTIAMEIARMGEKEIVQEEISSRVRPDTMGAGGPRMEDYLGVSRPLPRSLGSVGMNDEDELRQGGVDWWWTNEEGYSGHVGREVHGFFEPGPSRPGAAPSRTHPIFRPTGPRGPKMTIQEPIPERRFVERGGGIAEHAWHARLRASRQKMIASIEAAVIAAQRAPRTTSPKTGGARRRRRP